MRYVKGFWSSPLKYPVNYPYLLVIDENMYPFEFSNNKLGLTLNKVQYVISYLFLCISCIFQVHLKYFWSKQKSRAQVFFFCFDSYFYCVKCVCASWIHFLNQGNLLFLHAVYLMWKLNNETFVPTFCPFQIICLGCSQKCKRQPQKDSITNTIMTFSSVSYNILLKNTVKLDSVTCLAFIAIYPFEFLCSFIL